MIKWYFIKLLPVFIWILSEKLDAANGDAVAVDATNDEDVQTPWRPAIHQIPATADLTELFESKDENLEQPIQTAQRRFDDGVSDEEEREEAEEEEEEESEAEKLETEAGERENTHQERSWQPALNSAEQQPTVGFVVSATQSFSEDDTMPAIDRKNDWKSIETEGVVQSPMLQVQRQFNVGQVTGESDRPHYEPWVNSQRDRERERERERFVSSTTSTTTTQRYNKSYRKPYQSRRNEELRTSQTPPSEVGRTVNLKNILKQTGGLSLSEILQQQNLSLEDLLKGKQNAIKALQNTAPPPSNEPIEDEPTKSTRRLPLLSQMNVNKPRRNFFNGTTRVANRTESSFTPTPQIPVKLIESVSGESTEKRGISTIPPYLADVNNKYGDETGVRRLPTTRGKLIKEVVPGIRPDLNNSHSRKRMPNLKLLQSKATSTVQTMSSDASVSRDQENMEHASKAPELNEEHKLDASDIYSSTNNPDIMSTTTTTTTTSTMITSSTAAVPKLNFRERMALRPPRLRNFPSNYPPSTTSVETSSSTQPTIEITLNKMVATSEDPIPYTVMTTTIISNEQRPTESNEMLDDSQPVDELNKKLNESVPELNLVDLEDESKSKEVTSLEDLFISDSMDPMNDDDENGNLGNEFVHASSTSRSDNIFKPDKPNSLKIFGGNLVNIIRKTIDKLDVTERNPGLFTDITQRYVDDKTELMDLLSDRRSGARLVKVLRQRNMTIDELIEHRKRGSSQVHLAEIFFNRSKAAGETSSTTPSPQSQQHLSKLDVVTAFKNFPEFKLDSVKSVNPDEIKTDSQGSSYFTSIENIQPTAEVMKESRAIRKPFVIKLAESATKHNIPTQLWNTEAIDSNTPHSEHNFLDNASPAASLFTSKQHILRPSTGDETNMNTAFHDVIDQNRNDAAARSHDPLDLELSGHGYKRNSVLIENAQMPIGVRSAIVASASIVLISLTIFFVIFMVCRWRQRRKRKICYSDRFQALRGRLPILGSRDASPSKRSTSPAIAYLSAANSSRRSSKLNTMDPNSPEVQEYLYDAMRKPFQ